MALSGDRKTGPVTGQAGSIEIELRKISQLFNTLDPSPFRDSDLAKEAEDYIVDRATELPKDVPISIVIHLPPSELSQASAVDISGAVKNYFQMRVRAASMELRELFKTGRLSLVVGLAVLSICFLLGLLFVRSFNDGPFSDIMRESFLIFGWVAIWKPSEIFLYAWPPIARRRRLFERLAAATVTVNTTG
ncbi:MAG: hypothetical protein EKK40_16815 [Bradyrhizobiaceae bacterium]|nr:MAG: hypothetical protein EKK40_16815 [Bradyrhizobiaceae bacterium]